MSDLEDVFGTFGAAVAEDGVGETGFTQPVSRDGNGQVAGGRGGPIHGFKGSDPEQPLSKNLAALKNKRNIWKMPLQESGNG